MNDSAFVYAYHVANASAPRMAAEHHRAIYTRRFLPWAPPQILTSELLTIRGCLQVPWRRVFGFLDTTQLQSGTVGTPFLNNYLNPATGFCFGRNSHTVVSFRPPSTLRAASFFGQNPVPSFSVSGKLCLSHNAPRATRAHRCLRFSRVTVECSIFRRAFSYGPTILEVTPNLSSAEGGGVGVIYGYGFAPVHSKPRYPQTWRLPLVASLSLS